MRYAAEYAVPSFAIDYDEKGIRDRTELLASRLRASGSTFEVNEDDSRICFHLDPWGPARLWRAPREWQDKRPRRRDGNRYYYPCYGAYDEPIALATVTGGSTLTQNRENIPTWFVPEVLSLEIKPIECLGMPVAVIDFPNASDDGAQLELYKDPTEIPEAIYNRVGTAKPNVGLPEAVSGRVFTEEELDRLGTPLALQVEQAVDIGDYDRLATLATQYDSELVRTKDQLGLFIAGLLTWIARHLGENDAEQVLHQTAEVVMAPFIEIISDLSRKEQIQMWAMVFRAHGSTFCDGPKSGIAEYEDRIVFRGRPLGACGRMWAHENQEEVERISDNRVRYPTFGCYDSPMDFHQLRKPRGITHMKENYPIYSAHCHTLHEVYCIEQFGYPLWVEEHPTHDKNGITRHVHYKEPDDWPEEYYDQLEKEKPDSIPDHAP